MIRCISYAVRHWFVIPVSTTSCQPTDTHSGRMDYEAYSEASYSHSTFHKISPITITVTTSTEMHDTEHITDMSQTDVTPPVQFDCVFITATPQKRPKSNKGKRCESPSQSPKRPRLHIATQTLLRVASRDSMVPSSPSSCSSLKSASSLVFDLSRKPSIWLQKMIHCD
ncbi:hypothetical protein C8Q72DRAFT_848167 [Fomitopsis betulina]|nr:hypothetical protein C8Q72DRAFT_848167 [Fomitopsis betulina]